MKTTPDQPHKPDPTPKEALFTRRNILGMLAGSLALAPTAKALHMATSNRDHRYSEAHSAAVTEHETTEHPLDLQTAQAVLAAFTYFVGYKGIYQGENLSAKSAGTMVTLALGRTALLGTTGDQHLMREARKERGEIVDGIRNTCLLVAMADAATHKQTGVRANPESIFQESADQVLSSTEWGKQRPDQGASRETWLQYEKQVNEMLSGLVAEIMGFCGIAAPIATTFVSSAVANQMKEKVARAVFEQSVARAICARKAKNEALDMVAIQAEAKDRTENALNGPLGFTNLLLTTTANAQGSLVLGGAPYIFTVSENISEPSQFVANTQLGLVNALAAPLALSSLWLASVGVTDALQPRKIAARYIDTARASIKVFREKRSVSMNSAAGYTEGIVDALQSSGSDHEKKLADTLKKIPTADLQFDALEHLFSKTKVLNRALVAAMAKVKLVPAKNTPDITQLWSAFTTGKAGDLKTQMDAYVALQDDTNAQALACVFDDLVHSTDRSQAPDRERLLAKPISKDAKEYAAGQRAAEAVRTISESMTTDVNLTDFGTEVDRVLASQGLSLDVVKKALAGHTRIAGEEDVVPNEDVVQPHFVSHSAAEALWALLTQVPAVPSAVRFAEHIIPGAAGMEIGAKPTVEQLKKISTIVIALITGLSAVADNVAAMLFGKSVLLKFFEQTFGKPYMDEHPQLTRDVIAYCMTIAQNAGAITKLGSPTNFAQQKIVLASNDNDAQGIGIDRVDLPIGDTVKNVHAYAWNALFGGVARFNIHRMIDTAASDVEHSTRMTSRTQLFDLLRGV